jgi:halocyanin domain
MSYRSAGVSRRGFLQAAAGGTAVAAASAAAVGQETTASGGEERPDFGGYLDDVDNFSGVVDRTGQSEVTVEVGAQGNGGAFAFAPAAVHVDPGTTVVWEWTGEGGQHNVVSEDDEFESELQGESGATFEYTFESDGIYNYYCSPHKALGMKGSVVVGSDYPTTAGGQMTTTSGGSTATEGDDGGDSGGGGGGGKPDLGGYLDGANNYGGSVVDATGQSEVTIEVGAGDGLAFGPAGVHVDNGATVTWEWTGEGGAHNVVADDGSFESGGPVGEGGTTFEQTFEEDGIYNYYCSPHQSVGMLGSVVVGTDYPTASSGGEGGGSAGGPSFPGSALSIGVATSLVMSVTLGLTYFFMKYGGDYETPN